MIVLISERELRRAIAVKLALEGYVYRRIQKILEVSIGFISKWKTAFKIGGLEAIKSGYQLCFSRVKFIINF